MKTVVNKLADFVAPRDKWRGGGGYDDNAEIPAWVCNALPVIALALLLAWHIVYGNP